MDTDAINYCALTLAVVLVWHPLRVPCGGKWSPEALSSEMKKLPYGEMGNFVVNPLALHQSFNLFKKLILKIFGHELILNGRRNNIAMISEFMGLPEVQNGWEIKFTMSERDYEDLRVVEQMIGEKAKLLVRRHSKRELTFSSLTEFGASVFQRQLPVTREVIIPEEPGPTNTNKRRKTSDELGPKQLSNCGKDIMSMIVENICVRNEPATPYLIAAIKTQSLSSLDSISRSIFGTAIDKENKLLSSISDNPRVIDSVSLLPKRNIIFTEDEKVHVLRILDVIDSVMQELPPDHEIRSEYTMFEVTKMVLKKHPVYSELIDGSIERWSENRKRIKNKPGRKINSDFEAAVWGKMMICEFEKIEVRKHYHSISNIKLLTLLQIKSILEYSCIFSFTYFFYYY